MVNAACPSNQMIIRCLLVVAITATSGHPALRDPAQLAPRRGKAVDGRQSMAGRILSAPVHWKMPLDTHVHGKTTLGVHEASPAAQRLKQIEAETGFVKQEARRKPAVGGIAGVGKHCVSSMHCAHVRGCQLLAFFSSLPRHCNCCGTSSADIARGDQTR